MDLSFAYKAYCDKAKAVFLCLMQKKKSLIRLNLRLLAEMVDILPRLSNSPQGWLLAACGPSPCSHPHHLAAKKAPA